MFFIEFIFLPYEKKIAFSIFYYLGEKFGGTLQLISGRLVREGVIHAL